MMKERNAMRRCDVEEKFVYYYCLSIFVQEAFEASAENRSAKPRVSKVGKLVMIRAY